MQMKAAAARTAARSPNTTSTAKARPAASRMMAECRNRSGQGEKKERDSSIAIGAARFRFGAVSSGAGVAALAHIDGFVFWRGVSG